jgi:uncharacterized membrane protein
VYDRDVTQEEYEKTEKTEEVKAAQRAEAEAAQATAVAEGFRIQYKQAQKPKSAAAIGAIMILALGAFFLTRRY